MKGSVSSILKGETGLGIRLVRGDFWYERLKTETVKE